MNRVVLVYWTAGWAATAAILASVSVYALGSTKGQEVALSAEGTGQATLGGVTAAISAVVASAAGVEVTVTFEGRDDAGDTVEKGRSVLILDDGSRLDEQWGSIEGRTVTMRFGPLPHFRRIERVVLAEVAIDRTPNRGIDRSILAPVGSFRIEVADEQVLYRDHRAADTAGQASFGSGEFVIDRVLVADRAIVLHGRLSGYSREEIHGSLVLDSPRLTLDDGTSAEFVLLNIGFDDDDPGAFRMQFEAPVAVGRGAALLEIGAVASPAGEPIDPTTIAIAPP